MPFKVLIPGEMAREGRDYLAKKGYEIKIRSGTSEDILINEVKDCDAMIVRCETITRNILCAGSKLKVVSRHGVGTDNIDLAAASELGIQVTNAPFSNVDAVAEYTLGAIVSCARKFNQAGCELKRGNFGIRTSDPGIELQNKTLGIIGCGKIGSRVAKKALYGLDMKILAYDPYINKDQIPTGVELTADRQLVFARADFLTLHVPLTEETLNSVGLKEFQIMKSSAYLINTSRGKVVEENALVKALEDRLIAGAALDVFYEEPPLISNPLFTWENVILTPHNAGLTREALIRMAVHSAMGVHQVLSGEKPSWPVSELDKVI